MQRGRDRIMDLHGIIEGERFIKRVGPQHFFVKFQGFGISLDIIRELKLRGIKTVFFRYEGKRLHTYVIGLEDFLQYGQEFYFTADDLQVVCPVKKMSEVFPNA
jgi:hypothetical protein